MKRSMNVDRHLLFFVRIRFVIDIVERPFRWRFVVEHEFTKMISNIETSENKESNRIESRFSSCFYR